jgi:hypothetical protein
MSHVHQAGQLVCQAVACGQRFELCTQHRRSWTPVLQLAVLRSRHSRRHGAAGRVNSTSVPVNSRQTASVALPS